MHDDVAGRACSRVLRGRRRLAPVRGFWHAVTDFLDPAAPPLVEATGTQEAIASVLAVALGPRRASPSPGRSTARSASACRGSPVRGACSSTSSTSTRPTTCVFYRPAGAARDAGRRCVEAPVIAGSLRGLGLVTREAGAASREAQTGLVRTYALALAGGVGDPRPRLRGGPMTTAADDLSSRSPARCCSGSCRSRARGRRRSRCSSRWSRSASGSGASSSFDFDKAGLQFERPDRLVDRPRLLVPRRHVRLLAVARRPGGRGRRGGDRATRSGPAASGRAPTSGSCSS